MDSFLNSNLPALFRRSQTSEAAASNRSFHQQSASYKSSDKARRNSLPAIVGAEKVLASSPRPVRNSLGAFPLLETSFNGAREGSSFHNPKKSLEADNSQSANLLRDTFSFISYVPVPMCVIDSDGAVLARNEEFTQEMGIEGRRNTKQMLNILELISNKDKDSFYQGLKRMNETYGVIKMTIGVCAITRVKSLPKTANVYFDWRLSLDESGVHIIVTAVPCIETPHWNVLFDHDPSPSDEREPRGVLSRIDSEDDMALRAIIPESKWEFFKTKVESKTKKFVELREAVMRAHALEETLEMKRTFVRHVSHEIRTPLNVVMSGFIVLENMRSRVSVEDMRILEEMQSACNVAIEILNDLLTYEKLDSNSFALERAPCDMISLLNDVLKLFRMQAAASEIDLLFKQLSMGVNMVVNADAPKLSQVLRNLLSNALKFTPSGGSVVVSAELVDGNVRVQVHDTGLGMSVEDRLRLFSEFVQFNPNELQAGQGSGLGLYNSRRIMDLHGGRIAVDLEWDQAGSKFYIELPVTDAVVAPKQAPRAAFRSPLVRSNRKKDVHVLIVDDVPLCRKIHIRVMKSRIQSFDEASNGQEAVDKILESMTNGNPFDAVLMDNSMPVMNGTDAAVTMREIGYTGLIFGITGNAFQKDIDEFMLCGVDDVLIKPITAENFTDIMERIMSA